MAPLPLGAKGSGKEGPWWETMEGIENGMERKYGLIMGLNLVAVVVGYLLFFCFCHFLLTLVFLLIGMD